MSQNDSKAERAARIEASPQFNEGRFRNPSGLGATLQGNPLPLIGEYFFGNAERNPAGRLPLERPQEAWKEPAETGLRTTWMGHSTVLLEIDGRRLITDPVFGERVGPVGFIGPKRFHPVPVKLEELPPLDLVLLSHDHYDHLCRRTIEALGRKGIPIVTALGVGAHLERFGIPPSQITELDWHESTQAAGLHITATPAQHFSGRRMGDRNETLWASWVIAGDRHKVFYSGDTGLTDVFATIGKKHGPFDLAMVEIGAYHPSWGVIHLGPENALKVFDMLGRGTLLPVHWGTFNLALHAWNEPAETLVTLAAQQGLRVITPHLGSAVEPSRVEAATPWWREIERAD